MRRSTKGESVKNGATTSVSPPGGRLQYVELTPSYISISNGTLAQTEKQTKKIFCFSCIHFPKIASIWTISTFKLNKMPTMI